jgi:hypothetical protein
VPTSIKVSYEKLPQCRAFEGLNPVDILKVSFPQERGLSVKDRTNWIYNILEPGITLDTLPNRKFHFFGHSASQLRESKAYMVRKSTTEIEALIQTWGNFSDIPTPGKRAKRLGLLFSTADPLFEFPPEKVGDIPDIVASVTGECLTDGCGYISPKLAKMVIKSMSSKTSNPASNLQPGTPKILEHLEQYTPSVYQIRYLGYKGVLSLNPHLTSLAAQFRPSMKKFKIGPATPKSFSVVQVSKPYNFGYLNAQHVTLFAALDIPTTTFTKKMAQHYEFLEQALHDPEIALQLLIFKDRLSEADQILASGLDSVKKFIVDHVYPDEIAKTLDKRGERRVRILLKKSRLLFGVAEPGTSLKPDEVFVRITENGIPKTLSNGFVMVTRNPCLHPVRVLSAKPSTRKLTCVELHD